MKHSLRVALTGGIGSGKSEVLGMLRAAGATVLDADDVAREVVEPGTPGLRLVVEAFGPQVLAADGSLDRARLGEVVFGDEAQRRLLEQLLHPLIRRRSEELMAEAPAGSVVVYAIPLLAETGAHRSTPFDVVVTVEAPPDVRLRRLISGRGMSEDQVRARMTTQADDASRRALADVVLDNSGDRQALEAQVASLWRRLSTRAGGSGVEAQLGQQVGEQADGVGLDPAR